MVDDLKSEFQNVMVGNLLLKKRSSIYENDLLELNKDKEAGIKTAVGEVM